MGGQTIIDSPDVNQNFRLKRINYMIPALEQFPRFEKGSPSSEYRQIANFCTNYLEGMLVALMHLEIESSIESDSEHAILASEDEAISMMQQRMHKRDRTIRHALQFQIEKYFADFKSISRSRLRLNTSDQFHAVGLSSHKAAQIQPLIQRIAQPYQQQFQTFLSNTSTRLKTLVHRSDRNNDDNPISPINLCNAFQASIDPLNLSLQNNRLLLQLFDFTLSEQLDNFYQQIDLGFYYLDIMPQLTDPALFDAAPTEQETQQQAEGVEGGVEGEEKVDVEAEIAEDDTPLQVEANAPDEHVVEDSLEDELENRIRDSVSSLQKKRDENRQNEDEINALIHQFKFETENGTLNYQRLFSDFSHNILPLLSPQQRGDVGKFTHFYVALLNNALLSTPLKTQLSRLSAPLFQLVLQDPFFFRSSSHPVNDFLQSIVDMELRFQHQGNSLSFLSRLLDELLPVEHPTLSDYQPIIARYEAFKALEEDRLNEIREQRERQQQALKNEILTLVDEITASLVIERETMVFFYDDWQLHLLSTANHFGRHSAEFSRALDQAKILSWMLDKHCHGDHPEHPLISFKTLLKEIDISLDALNYSGEHRTRIRKQLVKEHKSVNTPVDFKYFPSTTGQNFQHGEALAQDNTQPVPPQNAAHIQAGKLQRGDWVDIKRAEPNQFHRAKLQWVSADRQQYSFIKLHGHRSYRYTLPELEAALAKGAIKLLSPADRYTPPG